MRSAQLLPRRSQVRPRHLAVAAAALLLVVQLRFHWRFTPLWPRNTLAKPAPEVTSEALWQAPGRGGAGHSSGSDNKKRVRAVIGVQTGFNSPHPEPRYDYALRRVKLRESWFPSDAAQLARSSLRPCAEDTDHTHVAETLRGVPWQRLRRRGTVAWWSRPGPPTG